MNSDSFWSRNESIWSDFQSGRIGMREREQQRMVLRARAGLDQPIPHSNVGHKALDMAAVNEWLCNIFEGKYDDN